MSPQESIPFALACRRFKEIRRGLLIKHYYSFPLFKKACEQNMDALVSDMLSTPLLSLDAISRGINPMFTTFDMLLQSISMTRAEFFADPDDSNLTKYASCTQDYSAPFYEWQVRDHYSTIRDLRKRQKKRGRAYSAYYTCLHNRFVYDEPSTDKLRRIHKGKEDGIPRLRKDPFYEFSIFDRHPVGFYMQQFYGLCALLDSYFCSKAHVAPLVFGLASQINPFAFFNLTQRSKVSFPTTFPAYEVGLQVISIQIQALKTHMDTFRAKIGSWCCFLLPVCDLRSLLHDSDDESDNDDEDDNNWCCGDRETYRMRVYDARCEYIMHFLQCYLDQEWYNSPVIFWNLPMRSLLPSLKDTNAIQLLKNLISAEMKCIEILSNRSITKIVTKEINSWSNVFQRIGSCRELQFIEWLFSVTPGKGKEYFYLDQTSTLGRDRLHECLYKAMYRPCYINCVCCDLLQPICNPDTVQSRHEMLDYYVRAYVDSLLSVYKKDAFLLFVKHVTPTLRLASVENTRCLYSPQRACHELVSFCPNQSCEKEKWINPVLIELVASKLVLSMDHFKQLFNLIFTHEKYDFRGLLNTLVNACKSFAGSSTRQDMARHLLDCARDAVSICEGPIAVRFEWQYKDIFRDSREGTDTLNMGIIKSHKGSLLYFDEKRVLAMVDMASNLLQQCNCLDTLAALKETQSLVLSKCKQAQVDDKKDANIAETTAFILAQVKRYIVQGASLFPSVKGFYTAIVRRLKGYLNRWSCSLEDFKNVARSNYVTHKLALEFTGPYCIQDMVTGLSTEEQQRIKLFYTVFCNCLCQ